MDGGTPPVIVTDGFEFYAKVIRRVFGPGFELTPILQPLERFRDRLLVVSGLSNKLWCEDCCRRGRRHVPCFRAVKPPS